MLGTSFVRTFLAGVLRDETGASAVEYGLIVALVAVLAVAGLDALGSSLSQTVSTANSGMTAN
ncbi:MAG: Flp family type IVb pilin [Gammaproteobacteria bacterium]|jgi:pilus assembly protein Flp/PilA